MEINVESTLLIINKKSSHSTRRISAVQSSCEILTVSRSELLNDTGFKRKKLKIGLEKLNIFCSCQAI